MNKLKPDKSFRLSMTLIGITDGKLKRREINLKEKTYGLIKIGTQEICLQKPHQLENLTLKLQREVKISSD